MSVSKENRLAIVDSEIGRVENTIYLMGVKIRAAKVAKDKNTEKSCNEQLESCILMLDELNKIREEETGESTDPAPVVGEPECLS
jgi:hypothetical protein